MGDFTHVLDVFFYVCAILRELVNGHEMLSLITPRVPRRTLSSGTSKHPKGA